MTFSEIGDDYEKSEDRQSRINSRKEGNCPVSFVKRKIYILNSKRNTKIVTFKLIENKIC